jgi:hypothetical protein
LKTINPFLRVTLILIAIILVVLIGIPTRVINKEIDESTFEKIKIAQRILSSVKDSIEIKNDLKAFSPLADDAYGYIDTQEKVDKLFPSLSNEHRFTIKALFSNHWIIKIDIMRPSCIRFTLKESYKNYFLTRSYETLLLIFNDSCKCDCQNQSFDDATVTSKYLGNGWHKTSIVTNRTAPHA